MGEEASADVALDGPVGAHALDRLMEEDSVVKHIIRAMRNGRRRLRLDDAVAELHKDLGIDHDRLLAAAGRIRELQRSIQQAREPFTLAPGGRESWYAGARIEDPNWGGLLELLRGEGWKEPSLDQLDIASTKVVAHLPDPQSPTEFHSCGLVLGYVQSGKTTNFTSVIAKAADAGYRMFIVLSGIHNALRLQTQERLNGQLWTPNPSMWHRLTDEEDFRPPPNVDALLNSGQFILAVVKKHGMRLRALSRWLKSAQPELLRRCPVLIIDDEADQASLNTARRDGDRTIINGLITGLIRDLPRVAYVGYTATPFANVLVDPSDREDLYPRDFIIDLPRPDNYVGPESIFGREPLGFDQDGDLEPGHDLIRSVPSEELGDLRPMGAASRHDFSPVITDSLAEALRYFLLSTAARRARGIGNRHATALIHTSQYTDTHETMARVLRGELRSLRERIAHRDPETMTALREQWERETDAVPAEEFDLPAVPWEDVAAALPTVAADAEVIVDNSRSMERLTYDADRPRVVVAVGGNTLSRGLTLEGLSVSYFVRTASAYDTLLQMGRWFGYRIGYPDLTRIWLPDDLREWFHHLATVEAEIRADIARYDAEHTTPEELAPRIRTHPKLAITAAAKMRASVEADVSYSGRRIQTILFNHRDREWLERNLEATRELIGGARDLPQRRAESGKTGVRLIGPVPSEQILAFLREYRFHENSRDLDGTAIREYIRSRMNDGELTHFTIAVMARNVPKPELGTIDIGLDEPVAAINRARLMAIGGREYADIKALMSKSDRGIDLGLTDADIDDLREGKLSALRNLPSQGGRGDGSGLLAIYPISPHSAPARNPKTNRVERTRVPLDAVLDVIGVGLVFPESPSAPSVRYVTANLADQVIETPQPEDEPDEPEIVVGMPA